MSEIYVTQTDLSVDVQVTATAAEVNVDVTPPAATPVEVFIIPEGSSSVTSNTSSDGSANLYLNTLRFNTAPTSTPMSAGYVWWDTEAGGLKSVLTGGGVAVSLGQQSVIRVVNKTNTNLLRTEYKVVRIRKQSEGGAQGQRLAVVLAQASTEMNSTDVIGLVSEDIADNQTGFVTIFGPLSEIDTTGAAVGETWLDGDILFLSPSVPGGMTKTKPSAPNHLIIVGYVMYAHANHGKLFVRTETSYELEELHNVSITSPVAGQMLRYDGSLWRNSSTAITSTAVPATSTSAGFTGEIRHDSTHVYVCVATNTWRRAALSTWP